MVSEMLCAVDFSGQPVRCLRVVGHHPVARHTRRYAGGGEILRTKDGERGSRAAGDIDKEDPFFEKGRALAKKRSSSHHCRRDRCIQCSQQ